MELPAAAPVHDGNLVESPDRQVDARSPDSIRSPLLKHDAPEPVSEVTDGNDRPEVTPMDTEKAKPAISRKPAFEAASPACKAVLLDEVAKRKEAIRLDG